MKIEVDGMERREREKKRGREEKKEGVRERKACIGSLSTATPRLLQTTDEYARRAGHALTTTTRLPPQHHYALQSLLCSIPSFSGRQMDSGKAEPL